MANPYAINPIDITPGFQMFARSVESRRKATEEKEAADAQRKLAEDAAGVFATKDPAKISQFLVTNPQYQQVFKGAMDIDQRQRADLYAGAAKEILVDGKAPFDTLVNLADGLIAQGKDASDILDLTGKLQSDPNAATQAAENMLAMFDPQSYQAYAKSKDVAAQAKKQKTGAYLVREEGGGTKIAVGVFDPTTGKLTTETTEIDEAQLVSPLGETAAEQTERKVQEEAQKAGIKTLSGVAETSMVEGIEAAKNVPTIKRAIDLLREIDTGGIDKVSQRVKQIFGVESADEGELSFLLGEAVLKQLKPTFGAQFTVAEGERLERLMAGFGKNPQANIRILETVLDRTQRKVKRGIRYAQEKDMGNIIQDINDFSAYSPDTFQPPTTDTRPVSTMSEDELYRVIGGR